MCVKKTNYEESGEAVVSVCLHSHCWYDMMEYASSFFCFSAEVTNVFFFFRLLFCCVKCEMHGPCCGFCLLSKEEDIDIWGGRGGHFSAGDVHMICMRYTNCVSCLTCMNCMSGMGCVKGMSSMARGMDSVFCQNRRMEAVGADAGEITRQATFI